MPLFTCIKMQQIPPSFTILSFEKLEKNSFVQALKLLKPRS